MTRVYVCTNHRPMSGQPSCAARGSREILQHLTQLEAVQNGDCDLRASVCMGHCENGPNIRVIGQPFLHNATVESAETLVLQALDQT